MNDGLYRGEEPASGFLGNPVYWCSHFCGLMSVSAPSDRYGDPAALVSGSTLMILNLGP